MEFAWLDLSSPLHTQERDLRFRVLRKPLGLPEKAVVFPFEAESLHLVALEGAQLVGCVLFHPKNDDEGRLFQMAIEPEWQNRGVGRALVLKLERHLQAQGYKRVTCHARKEAVGFYERLGYEIEGEPFIEVGIEHRHMFHDLG